MRSPDFPPIFSEEITGNGPFFSKGLQSLISMLDVKHKAGRGFEI